MEIFNDRSRFETGNTKTLRSIHEACKIRGRKPLSSFYLFTSSTTLLYSRRCYLFCAYSINRHPTQQQKRIQSSNRIIDIAIIDNHQHQFFLNVY